MSQTTADFQLATRGDLNLATGGDFHMAVDKVSGRGRIPASVIEQYKAANTGVPIRRCSVGGKTRCSCVQPPAVAADLRPPGQPAQRRIHAQDASQPACGYSYNRAPLDSYPRVRPSSLWRRTSRDLGFFSSEEEPSVVSGSMWDRGGTGAVGPDASAWDAAAARVTIATAASAAHRAVSVSTRCSGVGGDRDRGVPQPVRHDLHIRCAGQASVAAP